MVVDREAHSIESGKTILGTDPQIAVLGFEDPHDRVMRQPVVRVPHRVHVLREGLRRIQSAG
jgi:hypothetical protein